MIRTINIGGYVKDNSDAPKFFHVDSSNHLIVQRVVLVPAIIQLQSESQSPGDSGSTALASLNLFKANSPSQDRGAPPDDRGETRRILLDDPLDVGELKLNQRLKGLQLLFTKEWVRGAAWSDSELYVSNPQTSRVHGRNPSPGLRVQFTTTYYQSVGKCPPGAKEYHMVWLGYLLRHLFCEHTYSCKSACSLICGD